MAFAHGSKAGITINSVSYTQYLKDTGADMKVEAAETTALQNTAKNFIPGLKDGVIPLDGMLDNAVDVAIQACMTAGIVTFQYDPQGTAVGLPRYSGNCFFTKYTIKTGVTGAGSFSAEAQITNGWTRVTQ